MLYQVNNVVHVLFGSLALLGGLVALASVKGSRWHIRGGRLFALMMGLVVITTLLNMLHELLPLAVVLSAAEIYLIPSALLSVRRSQSGFVAWNIGLMCLAGLLGLFTAMQFVRFNLAGDRIFIGPLVLAAMFLLLFVQDWLMLRRRPGHPNFWLRRHLLRMILAFTIAIMALVRIGIPFGLSLEASVILPLAVAAVVILAVYRRYPAASGQAANRDAPGAG